MDSYLRQLTCVAWGLFKSCYFSLSNGVKQGGVLSPILFTLYIDKLLIRLKHAHIGCHMNNIFTGALSYADDITLICSSICGINNMFDICCEYAKEYDITFNPTKTVCIKYGDKVELNEHVVMNGNIIEWVDNVRYLGNFVDATLSDSVDCRYNRSMFICYVNKLISKFGHLQPKVLLNLFNTYCCSFYGSSTWGLHSNGFNSCVTAWNIGVRKILGLPYTTYTWMLGPMTNSVHMKYKLYIRDLKNLTSFSQCVNVLVRACFSIITNNANSILGNKLAYFRDRFAININRCTLNDNIKKRKLSTVISDEEQLIINNIWSLILVKSNQYYVQGFDGSEIGDILTFFSN